MNTLRTEANRTRACEHLSDLTEEDFPPAKTSNACEECLKEGSRWVSLRECRTCGHVGCCDSSPGHHATKHFHQTGHPVMRSVMPGDRWTWCYVHEVTGELAHAPGSAVKNLKNQTSEKGKTSS